MTENQVNLDAVLQEKAVLERKLKVATKSIEEYKKAYGAQKSLNEKLSGKVASIELERRKERIQTILQGAYKEEELPKMVESYAKSGMTIEDIQSANNALINANNALKAASAASQKDKEALKASNTKVVIKNAAKAEEQQQSEKPAYLVTHDFLFPNNGVN